jgi:ribonuclease R
MPEVYQKRIIKLLKHEDYSPLKLQHLARALGVGSEDYQQFKNAFDEMRSAGHVVIGAKNLITLPPVSGKIIGTFRANPRGFGFIVPQQANSHGDLFVPPGKTADAMTGDIVVAKVTKKGKRAGQMRYTGTIIEILERAQNKFVGTLTKKDGIWLVQPDGSAFFDPISVDDVTAKNAQVNDKVVVEVLTFPTDEYLARGVILEVLGKSGRYESEIKSVVRQYHLPEEFDNDCIQQARRAASKFNAENLTNREDITDKTIITIDPPDAKDFDDAISLEVTSDGSRILGVHIADVSTFIEPDSPLDEEAKSRGNSVYLPGRTIPMLPEILSNGVCSLQPQQKRFVKSAYLTYDKDANVTATRFANSVICSTQRLTYRQADKALKGKTKGLKPEVIELLTQMERLSRDIEARRIKNGMLHLEMPDTELVLDKSGRVTDAHPADDCYPHTIIEMFMVEANEAAASLLDRLDVAFMRRIHPEPDVLSMKNLAQIVRAFGYSLPRTPDRFSIQSLLNAVKGAPCSLAVNLAVLRSFEKAQYAPTNMGHYALASNRYCHFTSPIRRYADLLVHRAIQHHLEGSAAPKTQEMDLAEIGKHISFTEQRAEDAERELKTVLILQMLTKHIGDEIDCVITGLAGFGVFAQCLKYGIEGLIQMSNLGPDQWKFERKTQCILGQRTGTVIRIGQAIKVRILSLNVPARQLDVEPVESLVSEQKKERRPAPTGKRGKQKTKKRSRKRR